VDKSQERIQSAIHHDCKLYAYVVEFIARQRVVRRMRCKWIFQLRFSQSGRH